MSPLRRRKRRSSRARTRRQQLIERERLGYVYEEPEEAYEQPEEGEELEPQPIEEIGAEPAEPPPPSARRRARPARRPAPRRRRRARLGGLRDASTSGLRATARRTEPGMRRLARAVGRLIGWVPYRIFRLADVVERTLTAIFDEGLDRAEHGLRAAGRVLTPERVLVGVIAIAAACLGVSQFVAYRGVEVGQPQYTAVSDVAPPPQTDRIDAGAAHAYVLIPLAVLAFVVAVLAVVSGRWRLARVVSVIGLIGIAVSLGIDLPSGLDAGSAGEAFAGAKATMTEGFYAQLAASATLVLCGWLLAVNLRQRAGEPQRPRRARVGPRPRRAPSVAGGGA